MADPTEPKESNYEVEDGVILDSKDTNIDVAPKAAEPAVEVVDDTPPADRNRIPLAEPPEAVTDEELSRYADRKKIHTRLKQLNSGMHDERRTKEAALRERDEAFRLAQAVTAENQRLQGSLATNQNAMLEQAKRTVAGEIEEAKREYKAAQEAFDTDGIIAAQQKLTAATIRADRVNNFRPAPIQAPQNVVQSQPQVQQPPVVDSKTREWNEQNPWFGNDRKMTAYALSLHAELVESGVNTSSDDYFNRINADVRRRFPEAFNGDSAAAKSQRPKSNVVAPASRSTAPRKVVLTQTQVNLAKRLNIPLEAYARSVAELDRN